MSLKQIQIYKDALLRIHFSLLCMLIQDVTLESDTKTMFAHILYRINLNRRPQYMLMYLI